MANEATVGGIIPDLCQSSSAWSQAMKVKQVHAHQEKNNGHTSPCATGGGQVFFIAPVLPKGERGKYHRQDKENNVQVVAKH